MSWYIRSVLMNSKLILCVPSKKALLRRSGGNLRAVQEHLRHADIQTTTVYTRLTQSDLQKVISEFDKNNGGENRDSRPSPHGT